MQLPKSFGTHDGVFHADEVTACALLIIFKQIDRDKIVRTRNADLLETCDFVCDVGGVYDPSKKRFDHHQVTYQGPFSSAGMVLFFLKNEKLISSDLYEYLNNSLIIGVDAHDTGCVKLEIGFCSFSQVVSNFLPAARDFGDAEITQAFFAALDFVLGHLQRLLGHYDMEVRSREKFMVLMEKSDKYIVCDEPLPWLEAFFRMGGEKHPALFIVMPSGVHWKLRAIPPSLEDRMNVRLPLPVKWGGLRDEELSAAAGIEGGIFCHKGLFISIWKTKDAVMKALQIALKEADK